jgi:hypothetical protein
MTAVFCLALAVVACRDKQASLRPPADPVVARVGDETITARRFRDALQARSGDAVEVMRVYSNKLAVLDELLRTELIVAQARRDGFADRPDIQEAIKQLIATRYTEEVLAGADHLENVEEADVLAYYEGNPDLFRTPDLSRAAVIWLELPLRAPDDVRSATLAVAQRIREEALALGDDPLHFGELAARYSADQATRYKGGDAGWLSRGEFQPRWSAPAMDAFFALQEPGEISPVVATDHGVYLFRLMERRPSSRLPFDLVKQNVAYQIAQERRRGLLEAVVDKSRSASGVTIYEDAVRQTELPPRAAPVGPAEPPAMPNG